MNILLFSIFCPLYCALISDTLNQIFCRIRKDSEKQKIYAALYMKTKILLIVNYHKLIPCSNPNPAKCCLKQMNAFPIFVLW